jgi:hypothetical protein
VKKAVAILGCGPAGLLVAHAVQRAGYEPIIFSRKEKSVIPGSQYLHAAIPDLTPVYPEGTVQYIRLGTAGGYALKVYGDEDRETGWDNYYQLYKSWNVLRAYDRLWSRYENEIIDVELYPEFVRTISQMHDLTVSTVPAPVLCANKEHEFKAVRFWIRTLPTPPHDQEHDVVVYNGLLSDPWYRWSILSGVCSIEYTRNPAHLGDSIEGKKVISNTCGCWPTIHRCGRWAEWRHGVLLNDAFDKATRILEEL